MYSLIVLLHVLGATIWAGGHLVLALTILPNVLKNGDVDFIRKFESGYEKIGIPALITQMLTGLWLAAQMVPDVSAWLDLSNPISKLVCIKIVLLIITVIFAAHARLRIIPKLSSSNIRSLALHIIPVTIIAVLFVVAGVLYRFGWLG